MSWWLQVSREDWRTALSAQAPRMATARVIGMTAKNVTVEPRKFDSGSTLIVRTRRPDREPEA